MRRYDRIGNSTLEISLNTLEFAPEATAKRRVIQDQDEKGKPIDLKPVINAVGVDPVNGDIWIAIDDELVHFDSSWRPQRRDLSHIHRRWHARRAGLHPRRA